MIYAEQIELTGADNNQEYQVNNELPEYNLSLGVVIFHVLGMPSRPDT